MKFRNLPLSRPSLCSRAVATAICVAYLLCNSPAQAVTYTWINAAGGSWSTGANWSGGIAPVSASGATADFSRVGLTANTTVAVDTAVTVGNVIIGNTNTIAGGTPHNWLFTDNGNTANTLTLAGGSSTITITNMGTGTNLVDFSTLSIAGTGGLTVNGGGVLELDVTNIYTGGTTIAGGSLIIGTSSSAGENGTDVYTLGSSTVTAPSILRVNKTGFNLLNPISLATGAAGPLILGNYRAQKTDFFGNITLNGNDLVFTNGADNTSNGKFLVSDTITGTGDLTFINNSPAGNLTAGMLNNTGAVTLQGTSADTSSAFIVTFGPNVSAINYVGPATVGSFSAPANPSGLAINSSSTVDLTNLTMVAGLSNLTLNANNSGAITIGTVPAGVKGFLKNSGTGTGRVVITAALTTTAGISNIVQNSATSPLIFSGANSYTAPTSISNGTLLVNGPGVAAQAGSAITVYNGGSLSGVGTIANLITVQAGGTLAPGTNDGATLGTLVITNDASNLKGALALSGNLFFKLDKGLTQSNDLVSMVGTANTLTNLGTGTLTVTNLGPALVPGDTFYLFSQALRGGNNLTIVGSGNTFTNNLAVNGSISVAVTNGSSPASGVWVAANGGGDGLWTGDTGNWSNNVVARNLGQTATFNQGDYTGTQTVHVDAPVTNGYEIFGTTDTGTVVQWLVDNHGNSANILTLATTSSIPVITVSDPHTLSNNAVITAVIAGNQGLALNGGGKLTLGNGTTANTFTGGITVSNGTLFIETNAYADTTSQVTLGSTLAGSAATLLLGNTAFPNPIVLAPGAQGSLTISGDPVLATRPDLTGPAVDLNGNTLTFIAVAGSTGNSYLQNGVTDSGNLILVQNSTGTLLNNGTYNNSGAITLQGTGAGALNLGTLSSNLTTLNYNSSTATISGTPTILANNAGTTINSGSILNLGVALGSTGTNLVLNCNSSGNIQISAFDYRFAGFVENSGTGTGATTITPGIFNNSGLTKMIQNSATSPLILAGKNYYNVPTVVSNGWLVWNCGYTAIQVGSPITVNNGGILSGTGWIPNLVTVQPGGILAPGTNDGYTLGTLIITNAASTLKGGLSLSGNLFFKLHKGLTQSNDVVSMVGATDALTNLGTGTLTITNVGPALVAGDTFYLFSQALIGGNNLTIVSPGNTFTNNLAVNGSISVTGNPPPPPVITSLSPTSGPAAGGTLITITGTNFVSGDTVLFGANAGTGVTVHSSTNLTVTTPAGAAGAVNVKVTDTSSQSSTLANGFTYTLPPAPVITRLSPTNGYTTGGTSVTITGTNFASGDTVFFGANAGTGVTINSSTNLTVTTPAGAAGAVNVKVTDTSSQSSTLANGFTYTLPPAPVITRLSPTNGYTTGGTSVTITGTNFASGDTVLFGANAGTGVTINSSTNLTVTTPTGSAGAVNVKVTDTSSQSSTLTNGFTYLTPPVSGSPAIVITNMPPFGTFGTNRFLSGYVTNANLTTNCLVVYDFWPNENPSPAYDAKLTPWGWFSRPTFANQLTPIHPDGSWSCAMPSNFDQYATEYAVMLVPTNYSRAVVNAASGLPIADINVSEAITYASRVNTNRRAINWAGYGWWVKTAGADGDEFLGETGPGPNYYSDSTNNVWVDAGGVLHLQITHTNSTWQCVQIWNDQTLGYGQYSCTLNANVNTLDANAIFSLFTWSDDDDYVNREIDMEVSRWGYAFGPTNVEDFAISPYHTGQTLRFGLPSTVTNSTHSFTWTSTNSVQFETYNGNYSPSPASSNLLESWTTTAQPIPPAGGENATLILWLYHGSAPTNGLPVQVTLSDFVFTPAGALTGGSQALKQPVRQMTGQPTGLVKPDQKSTTVYFSGTADSSYSVQRSTNLTTGWVTVWSTNAPAGGLFNYNDTFGDLGGVPPAAAYYRLSSP